MSNSPPDKPSAAARALLAAGKRPGGFSPDRLKAVTATMQGFVDRGELGGPGEGEEAERLALGEREARAVGAQAVDEPEADRRDDDPRPVEEEAPPPLGEREPGLPRTRPRRPLGPAQRRKVFAQLPSQTT